jgi:protein O-mannosyl-transferase
MFLRNNIRIAILIIIVVFSFLPIFSNSSFVWDDYVNILEYAQNNTITVNKVLSYWEKPFEHLYIPVTYSIWSCIWEATSQFVPHDPQYQIHANVLHVTNLLFHIFNAILIFLIISRLVNDKLSALLGSVLFGIHPVQVETVAYISEFRSLLACFFSLLSIHQYLMHYSKNPVVDTFRNLFCNQINSHYFLSLLFFILALLSKPVCVVVPIFILILNAAFFKKNILENIVDLLPFFVLVIPIVIITKLIQPDTDLSDVSPIWLRPFVMLDAATFYLGKLVFPDALGIDYARAPKLVLGSAWGYFTGLIALGLIILLSLIRRKHPESFACYLIFLAGILPVSGIVPFNFQNTSTVADRYLYFSMMGPAVASAIFIHKEKNWVHLAPVFLIVAFLMMATYVQAKVWDNGIKLYTQALRINPNSYNALNNLATTIRETDPITAMTLYHKAIKIKPDHKIALANLAFTILKIKELFPTFQFSQFIIKDPDMLKKETEYFQEGVRLFKANNVPKALEQYGEAIAIDMLNPKTYNNVGVLILSYKDQQYKSIRFFRLATTLAPENITAWNNLAIETYYLGNKKTSIEYFNNALAIKKNIAVILSNRDKALKNINIGKELQEDRPKFEYLLEE